MKKLSFLLIMTFSLSSISNIIKAQVNKQDSLALVALYDSTGGVNWGIHKHWLTKAPVSTWWGIGVDSNNRIDSIDLSYLGLSGNIPYSLGNLTNLRYFALTGNSLTGAIPASFADLTNLVDFNLNYNNGISGMIPSYLGNFTNLQYLELEQNQLKGSIPSSLGNLTNLIGLRLDQNQLSDTIPTSLGNLTNLTDLELYSNQLTGSIPTSFDSLSNLEYFFLYNNQLSGTIPSLSNLTNLYEGVVSSNKFTFAGMEAIAQNMAYTVGGVSRYTPQATVPLLQNNADTTLSVSVGGTPANDTYKWYRNGTLVATKVADSTYKPTTSGKYWVAATNSVATQLTLYSDTININYPINKQDSLALVALYNITGGANWVNHTNWLTAAPVNTWYGVTTYNWRVTGIALDSNNLKGAIPSAFDSLPYLSSLKLSNNQLTFAGLEGIAGLFPDNLNGSFYAPQATVPLLQNGDTLSVSVGGTPANNTYKWYKNDTLVATITSDSTYTFTTNGKYWVVATNAIATELTLYSDTITIAGLPIKDITLSAKETNGQVMLQWQTIGELNTASFIIQRSTDGRTFIDLATKEAVGSGNNGYGYVDAAAGGVNYYRIKSIDKDGAFSYSNVSSLTINDSRLTIYPNPAKDILSIRGIATGESFTASIVSVQGKKVSTSLSISDANASLGVKNLSAGMYLLELLGKDGDKQTIRFVKE